jgi:hypothetical protein
MHDRKNGFVSGTAIPDTVSLPHRLPATRVGEHNWLASSQIAEP